VPIIDNQIVTLNWTHGFSEATHGFREWVLGNSLEIGEKVVGL